jgi:hypothetical protein
MLFWEVGGSMAPSSRARLYLGSAIVAIAAALAVGFYGLLLLVSSLSPRGSTAGNLLLGLFGVAFLVAAPVLFHVGNLAWKKSKSVHS